MNVIEALTKRRQATGAVTEALRLEKEAAATAEAATRARQEAEKAVGSAVKEAERAEREIRREAERRLEALKAQFDQLLVSAEETTPLFGPQFRIYARSWIYRGDEEALKVLTSGDQRLAWARSCHQQAGDLMEWIVENEAGNDAYIRADELECKAWSIAMARVRVLAGERS